MRLHPTDHGIEKIRHQHGNEQRDQNRRRQIAEGDHDSRAIMRALTELAEMTFVSSTGMRVTIAQLLRWLRRARAWQ